MAFSNADKAKHGRNAQDSLESILRRCCDAGYLVQVDSKFHSGREGYAPSQFRSAFRIVFEDETKWLLFTTTSMRSDRIESQQWNAYNLRDIDPLVTKAYLVYSDGLSEADKNAFKYRNQQYVDKKEYSFIDGVVSQDEINNMIEEYALKNKSSGQIKDIQGNSFEDKVADILSHSRNLIKWKNNDKTEDGMHYDLFISIVNCFGLTPDTVLNIEATSDKKVIGRLPSGGNPKTDVLVTVTYTDNTIEHYTISCKRSSDKSVSVHQYNSDSFADVIDKDNTQLRRLLSLFQACGNLRDFGEENQAALTAELAPYIEKLSLWVLGGVGGEVDSDTQNAQYILTYDNNDGSSSISRIDTYYQHLIDEGVIGNFGTPFSWTYPSKRKGQDIQLKCKIIK